MEGVAQRQLQPSPVGSLQTASVGESTNAFVVIDPPLGEAFWQSMDTEHPEDELTDEMESVEGLTRVSSREFRFYRDGQRLRASSSIDADKSWCSHDPTMKPIKPQPHLTYSSFSPQDSDIEAGEDGAEEDNIKSLPEEGIVVLSDIEDDDEEEEGETSSRTTNTSPSTGSDSDSTLPTRSPPNSPIRTCKAPKSSLRRKKKKLTTISFTSSTVTSSSSTIDSSSSPDKSPRRKKKSSSTAKVTVTSRFREGEKGRGSRSKSSSKKRSGHTRSANSSSSSSPRSKSHTRSANSSTVRPKSSRNLRQKETTPPRRDQLTRRMPRRLESSGLVSLAEDSMQPTIITRWQRHCESWWAPMLLLDLWDTDDVKGDDETLATFEEEMSFEDEGNVDVFVAVQATVLGTDFPEALSKPKNHTPHVWGSNFVGVVQHPKGDTVHSRRFPPGCRVASISAWCAASHKPYIVCNTSNLLSVPPLDGLHLDGTEVSVIAAAYLPAFQALHHGQRHHRLSAYEPTALEGQRILILAHSNGSSARSSGLNQSLVDARVQAAVRMALWAGARDVHVTVTKAGNTKRNIFGNDYRVRLLDTPPEDWMPVLRSRMNLVLDFTGPNGFSFGKQSTCNIAEQVLSTKKNGRYVGCLGEELCSPVLDCRVVAPISKKNQSTWSEGISLLQGKKGCASPAILPEGKDIRHVMEWTALCMKMQRASLFDFYGSWKHDRRLAEYDFHFLLELLAKRQIRPHIAKVLDVDYFPSVDSNQLKNTRSMSGAVVCEPWSQFKDADNLSQCSTLS